MTFAPLQGLRVIDGSRGGAGSHCTTILASLGAEVVGHPLGAEQPETPPDDFTFTPSPTAEARTRLARPHAAEILVTDLEPSESEEFAEHVRSLARDGLVVVSVTAFGLEGPYAVRGGPSELRSLLDAPAVVALTGAHAAVAALAALRWSRFRREGVWADISALELLATCSGEKLLGACGRPRPPVVGSARPEVLPCADGYVAVAVPTAVDRGYLAALVGMAPADPEPEALRAHVIRWLAQRTRAAAFHDAQLWRLPLVPVLRAEEVMGGEYAALDGGRGDLGAGRSLASLPFRLVGAAPSPPPSPRGRGDSWGRPSPSPSTGGGGGQPPSRSSSPLADVRVLDLGMVWAGPYCGRLLAHLGAEVIKIEGPARHDGPRPPDGWEGCSGTFGDLNAGKHSLVMNLATEAGRSAFLRLAPATDVVVESFSPRVMPNLGLDYANLAAANPAIVMLLMPAFPSDGPCANYVAYGAGLELATGLWRTGADGRPEPAPVPFLDYLAGAYGAAGILAAIIARDSTGAGCHIEVAQREVARHVLQAQRSGLDSVAPIYPSFDGSRLACDPHLSARGLFGWEVGEAGRVGSCQHFVRPPWKLGPPRSPLPLGEGEGEDEGVPSAVSAQRAQAFGADSVRVLCEVGGMDQSEVDGMIRDGIVLGCPAISTEGKERICHPDRREGSVP